MAELGLQKEFGKADYGWETYEYIYEQQLNPERDEKNLRRGESSKNTNAAMRGYVPPDDSIESFYNSQEPLHPTNPYGADDLPTMDDSGERTYFGSEGPLKRPEQRGDREDRKKSHLSVGRPHVRKNGRTYISEPQLSELVRVVEQEDKSMESVAIHYGVTEKVCQDKYNKYLEKKFRGY